jgi:hypothetical protein
MAARPIAQLQPEPASVAFEQDDESRILQYRLILQYHLRNMAQF